MTLKIEISLENAAFEGEACKHEVSRILHHAAQVIEIGNMGMVEEASMNLRDSNGNKVGKAEVVEQ